MSDNPKWDARTPDEHRSHGLGRLASQALSVVASRGSRVERPVSDGFLFEMQTIAMSFERRSFAPLVGRMLESGISVDDVADRYVPALARRLGALWCEDEMSFAEVTIGSARLMGLLRELGPEWRADTRADADAPSILVAVGHDVHHTLGATVLAGQMRRRGLSVRLAVGVRPEELTRIMQQGRFDAVLLSASMGENLESLRKLVENIRQFASTVPPVVLGGTIIDTHHGVDLRALTGADHVTSDADEALELCGLTIPSRGGDRQPRGG